MERYNYNGKEIIGIDHGFGNIKCRHVVFRSGVRAYDTEPPMTADALYYGGKYYVIGEEHKGFVSDKSQDEDHACEEASIRKREKYGREYRKLRMGQVDLRGEKQAAILKAETDS